MEQVPLIVWTWNLQVQSTNKRNIRLLVEELEKVREDCPWHAICLQELCYPQAFRGKPSGIIKVNSHLLHIWQPSEGARAVGILVHSRRE